MTKGGVCCVVREKETKKSRFGLSGLTNADFKESFVEIEPRIIQSNMSIEQWHCAASYKIPHLKLIPQVGK